MFLVKHFSNFMQGFKGAILTIFQFFQNGTSEPIYKIRNFFRPKAFLNLFIWENFINMSTPFFRAWRESAVTCGKHCNFFTPSAKGLVFCWNGYKA